MPLSKKQIAAIALRVSIDPDTRMLPSITDLMKRMKLSRQSWYDWMEQEDFRSAYKKALEINVEIDNAEVVRQLAKTGFNPDQRIKLYLADKPQKIDQTTKHEGSIEILLPNAMKDV